MSCVEIYPSSGDEKRWATDESRGGRDEKQDRISGSALAECLPRRPSWSRNREMDGIMALYYMRMDAVEWALSRRPLAGNSSDLHPYSSYPHT